MSNGRVQKKMPSMNEPCLFRTIPLKRVIAENELVYATADGLPATTGHTLVIPRRHVGDSSGLTEAELIA